MGTMKCVSMRRRGMLCGIAAAATMWAMPGHALMGGGFGSVSGAEAEVWSASMDVITFRSGNTVEGEILEETDRTVKVRVVIHGISTVTTYDKGDILSIKRTEADGDEPSDPAPRAEPSEPVRAEASSQSEAEREGSARVYVVQLDGRFGRDISQTPILQAIENAHSQGADHLIFVLDNVWQNRAREEARNHELAAFDQLFRAQEIFPLFQNEIPRLWGTDRPEVVFWVKQAMGGAAFLPLISENIYFAPGARMGGIGNLSRILESWDEVVRQKQISLRLATAVGAARVGGYPAELVRAMTMIDEVYSYRIVNGRPLIIQGYPDPSRGEILLTDDGTDENADTVQEETRNEGNDVLTLNADLARKLEVSDGTVSSLDDLLFALGIDRDHVRVDDQSDRIMDRWEQGVTNAERQLRKLWEEYTTIQVQGDYAERTRARGIQKRSLQRMIGLIRRYGEALALGQLGIPDEAGLRRLIERINLEQLADSDD